MFVVFDLDGTLALNEHREHYVSRPVGEKDWKSFFEACDKDIPNHALVQALLSFYATGWRVEIWSGRSNEVDAKTNKWLAENGIGHIPRRHRQSGDHTADTELKAAWLAECDIKPNLVFDDRASVVAMWREHGIVCAQVAPGEF